MVLAVDPTFRTHFVPPIWLLPPLNPRLEDFHAGQNHRISAFDSLLWKTPGAPAQPQNSWKPALHKSHLATLSRSEQDRSLIAPSQVWLVRRFHPTRHFLCDQPLSQETGHHPGSLRRQSHPKPDQNQFRECLEFSWPYSGCQIRNCPKTSLFAAWNFAAGPKV